jgi:hypothetical protein
MTLKVCSECSALLPDHETGCSRAGVKFDGDKPRMGLIPPMIEVEVADVLTFGAAKYPQPDNWKRVEGREWRYVDAALRHLNAHRQGEKRDPETGKLHLAHAICCLMFLGEMELDPDLT